MYYEKKEKELEKKLLKERVRYRLILAAGFLSLVVVAVLVFKVASVAIALQN